MTTNENNTNLNDDNIVAIIDGVVYEKRPKGRPRNPLRWTENGTHISATLDREKRLEYNKKYYALKTCEFCGKEIQIHNSNRHYKSSKCSTMKELQETKEKLTKLESLNNIITN